MSSIKKEKFDQKEVADLPMKELAHLSYTQFVQSVNPVLSLVFGLVITFSGCVAANEKAGGIGLKEPVFHVYAPDGVEPPAGLEQIKQGMTQAQVMRIISPIYRIRHSLAATENSPVIDSFEYLRDGIILQANILYGGEFVDGIRYGYEDDFIIN